jgi:hypothetical protein
LRSVGIVRINGCIKGCRHQNQGLRHQGLTSSMVLLVEPMIDADQIVNLWLTLGAGRLAPAWDRGLAGWLMAGWIDQSPPRVRRKVDAVRGATGEGSGLCPVSP